MTIEQVAMMTADEARQATDRIRLALDRVSTAWADLAERVEDAHRRRADLALGYASWNEYAAAELQPPHSLATEVRRELVGLLSARGMSTRAIAPVAGVTHKTVILDRQVVPDVPPETSDRIDLVTGEVLDATFTIEGETITTPVAPTVTGLDGKTYKRPEPNFQRRAPLPEAIASTVYDVARKVERLERMVADDRLPQNRDKIAVRSHSDLVRIIDALQRVADQINPNQE